jgi:hypothetical protein
VVPHLGAALGRTRITEKANEAEFTAICDYLAALGPEAKDAVPPLIMLLNSVPPTLEAVIRVLGEIGPAAKEAVPRLMEFRQSEGFSGLSLLELGRLKKTAAAAIEKIQK